MFFEYIFIFIFGLIIGSFLNVVIFRLESKKNLLGRSACTYCKKKLSWYELVPVFSFLFQKGKCRGCAGKISLQYPVVELLTGIVFLIVYSLQFTVYSFLNFEIFEYLNLLYLFVIFSILIAITVYDLKHKIIPDRLVFLFAGLSFVGLLVGFGPEINKMNLFSGIILATPFALLWLISKGEWIGLGDAKLALGIGWFLGLVDGISAVVLSFWIGSIFGLILVFLSKLNTLSFMNKNFTIKSEIPFAPFMIIGMILIFFFGWDLLGLNYLVSSW